MNKSESEFGIDNPISGTNQPKSNKKLWIYGGLGCFGVIGLVCVGCFALGYFAAKPTLDFMNENKAMVESSQEIQDILGSPVTVGDMLPQQSGPGSLTFRGPVSGPNGSGTYVIEATQEGLTPVRNSFNLEFEGDTINLDPDEMFNLDVDDGSGGAESPDATPVGASQN